MPNYNGVWSISTQYQYADSWNDRGLFAAGIATNNAIFLLNSK